jgi:hypothetical protein
MKRAILSVALAIAVVGGLSAQDKPNAAGFAGTWKPVGSFRVETVKVEGNKMLVTSTVAGNTSEPTEFNLDGTPAKRTNEGPNGPIETIRTSKWEGHVLVTTTEISNGSVSVEKRWLEPDGTMRVQTTLTMMQGKPAPPPPPSVAAGVTLKRIK